MASNNAVTYIAESIVKAVGVAGIEAMAMKNAIYSIWKPIAEDMADEVINIAFNFADSEIRLEYVESVYQRYVHKITSDFIEEAAPFVEEYAGRAWERGREYAFNAMFSGLLVKDQDSIISELVSLTGSTKANVQRTIKRWFEETQGQYFQRFIVPETARLLSYKEGANLKEIGERYKEFVKAEGYWSSVSEFNAESSKVFAQVQALHEMNVSTYTIEAIIDNKTCEVCLHLNGSTWSVEEAITKVYDMLIAEPDAAYEMNPFPPRSTPKDFPDPKDSPYILPPYHPRCRCSVRSEFEVRAMPQEMLARPFDAGPKPTFPLTQKVYDNYINVLSKKQVEQKILDGEYGPFIRALTKEEKEFAKEAWGSMPMEVKKWAVRNKYSYNLVCELGESTVSRVSGDTIYMNAKYLNQKAYGHLPLQHELRHALVNDNVITARGGGNTIWRELTTAADDFEKKGWRMPQHANAMYQLNGPGGLRAARAASDEFLALIGDYYEPRLTLDQLVAKVRNKNYGIDISDKIGSNLISKTAPRWTAKEAKNACSYWWYAMDIDNYTLMSKKQMLAKLTYKPTTVETRAIALQNEIGLRDLLRKAGIKKVAQLGDNEPFDVWIGADPDKWYAGTSKTKPSIVIEVKTIIRAKNSKITMHGDSLARKRKEWRQFGKKNTEVYTIVFDERYGKYYIRNDVGSFRLSAMQEVSLGDIQEILGGKRTEMVTKMPTTSYRPPAYSNYEKAKAAAKKYVADNDYQEIIDDYVRGPFAEWNRILRSSTSLQGAFDDIDQGLAMEVLWDAIESSPKYRGIIHRGVGFEYSKEFNVFKRQVENAIKNNDALVFKGFTSGTPDIQDAYRWMRSPDWENVVIRIKTKGGMVFEGLTPLTDEKEVVINAYSKYKIKGWRQVPHPHPPLARQGKKIWMLDLEEVVDVRQMAPSTERLAAIRAESPTIKTKPASSLKTKDTISNGNANEVRIVTVGTGRKKYIFKPIEGESFFRPAKPWDDTIGMFYAVKNEFHVPLPTSVSELTDEMWEYLGSLHDTWSKEAWIIRETINNMEVTLTQREAFALDVAQRLKLNNEYAIVPKFLIAENDDGTIAGVLIEFIEKAAVEPEFIGRQLLDEESFQMAVFDYLIGNTDRHENNWMRMVGVDVQAGRRKGVPVYIDHGYSMPSQLKDLGGLAELRANSAMYARAGMEYDMDPDWVQDLAERIQTFVDKDATKLARSYGFSDEEIDALLRRGDSLAERLRGWNFSDILVKHEQNGLWGVTDSYIGG